LCCFWLFFPFLITIFSKFEYYILKDQHFFISFYNRFTILLFYQIHVEIKLV
jgi:hypothetical protein